MIPSPSDSPLDVRVELADCTDKAGLLRRFAEAFRFPDWFGHNWDALADCLTDLSWLPAPAYRVVLCNPSTLRTTHPDVLATTFDILADTTRCWAEAGIAFSVEVMEDDAPSASARPPHDATR
ncbi:barstar family protein [Thauera sp. 63]|uniref:barstar family protein n=1 Tax=Thauera sp. 63 TaxID=497321 RepID=UPI0002FBA74A|nr:barstar family protein [Thauera sp. 63]